MRTCPDESRDGAFWRQSWRGGTAWVAEARAAPFGALATNAAFAARPNAEPLRYVEVSHVLRVLSFHVVQSFRDHPLTSADNRAAGSGDDLPRQHTSLD